MAGIYCKAFVDPSGGRRDAAALAISHRERDRVILDLARRWPAPHDPAMVVGEMAAILKEYRVSKVTGDRYAGAWPEKEFLKHNILYEASSKTSRQSIWNFFLWSLAGGSSFWITRPCSPNCGALREGPGVLAGIKWTTRQRGMMIWLTRLQGPACL